MRVLAIVAVAAVVMASPAFGWVSFNGVGTGDFMASPIIFEGPMEPPGDIETGLWRITIPDVGWPTDPVARDAYIWTTYYADNYKAGTPGYWTGTFDAPLNPLYIQDDAPAPDGGTMSGACEVVITFSDDNNDGELNGDEGCSGSLSGLVIIINDGTGAYDGLCGDGNYFGSFSKECPGTLEHWNFGMYLWLDDCSTPVESMTWGAVKALYQ